MSKYEKRNKVRNKAMPEIKIPDEPEKASEKKMTIGELSGIVQKLAGAQKGYQKETDKKFEQFDSRIKTLEQTVGVKKAEATSAEKPDEKKEPKKEPVKNTKTSCEEPKNTAEKDYVISDGPHVMWRYWDFKNRCWRGPKYKIGHALAAVGHDYNLVEEVCVWVKDGKIERRMTPEEIEVYLPS